MDEPIKIIWKAKNNNKRKQYYIYIFVGAVSTNIDNILENINKLNPVSYLRLEQNITHKKSYGFIAQEIYDIFPDIVNEPKNGDELYSINYTSIIPLLTKSIQELTKKIDLQQEEINYLKQKL